MKIKTTVILIFSIMLFAFFQYKYDSNTNLFLGKNKHVIIPSSTSLRILSFGNVNLVADLMYIWAIQFFATKSIKNRYDYAVKIFDIITDLNPKFEDPYLIGSTIIGLKSKNYRKAIDLLQKGKKYFKSNYYFDYHSGYFADYYLKDYKLAKKYYIQMSKYENMPGLLKYYWVNMDEKNVKKKCF